MSMDAVRAVYKYGSGYCKHVLSSGDHCMNTCFAGKHTLTCRVELKIILFGNWRDDTIIIWHSSPLYLSEQLMMW